MRTRVGLDKLFTRDLYDIVGGALDVPDVLNLVALLGRNFATGNALPVTVDSTGRLQVNDGVVGTTWAVIYDSGDTLGNISTNHLIGTGIWDIRGWQMTYNCDGTAANRSIVTQMILPYGTGATGLTNNLAYVSTALALIAGQDGGCWNLPNGQEVINTNGVLTVTANKAIVPIIVTGDTFRFVTVPTLGAAGDVLRLTVIGRKLA